MAPTIPSAKLTLSCPLFAADFDPRNSDYLLVGGGGGEGRSGVGNRIASSNSFLFHKCCLYLALTIIRVGPLEHVQAR